MQVGEHGVGDPVRLLPIGNREAERALDAIQVAVFHDGRCSRRNIGEDSAEPSPAREPMTSLQGRRQPVRRRATTPHCRGARLDDVPLPGQGPLWLT